MIIRETGTSLNNSVAYNVEKDDPTYNNYLCLYSIIKSKEIKLHNFTKKVSDIKKIFGITEPKNLERDRKEDTNKKKRDFKTQAFKYRYYDIKVEDEETGEILKFESSIELGEYFNVAPSILSAYIKNNNRYKKRYKITASRLETNKYTNFKVLVANEITGEEKVFNTVKGAADYIEASATNMSILNRNQRTTRGGWKVKYIEGE